jgi:hypothetical protein
MARRTRTGQQSPRPIARKWVWSKNSPVFVNSCERPHPFLGVAGDQWRRAGRRPLRPPFRPSKLRAACLRARLSLPDLESPPSNDSLKSSRILSSAVTRLFHSFCNCVRRSLCHDHHLFSGPSVCPNSRRTHPQPNARQPLTLMSKSNERDFVRSFGRSNPASLCRVTHAARRTG